MFASLSRFKRRIAVLTALAMVASVLAAVPAVAADPKADYTATFDACVGDAGGDAGFEDVPASHGNAGDINCIAYYGITKGTSATTFAPLMSVTREQMALFLTRLAGKVGIESDMMDDDMMGSGFTDIGDLSDESQKAIGLLKDLGITKGTSDTTYSPADNVSRGQMALFISRLMDQMTPQADGEIGLSSTTQYGYTPSDVVDNDMDADIGSPFGDISGSTPKEEYDAVTQL
nr:S-layer homology domain-containing protein [bacterium]